MELSGQKYPQHIFLLLFCQSEIWTGIRMQVMQLHWIGEKEHIPLSAARDFCLTASKEMMKIVSCLIRNIVTFIR